MRPADARYFDEAHAVQHQPAARWTNYGGGQVKYFEMKNTRSGIAAYYLATLRTHVRAKSMNGGHRAQAVGQAAVAAGLSTFKLGRMHEQALLTLAKSHDFTGPRNGSTQRAKAFLAQALIPLDAHRRGAGKGSAHLSERNATLQRQTSARALGQRRLEREVTRRKAEEIKIGQANDRYRALFLESQAMQDKLRHVARHIISAQEDERKRISRELHDEVVQTLVGINVELAALGRGANSKLLQRKIAHTQRLVETSVLAVHRFARDLRPTVLDDLGLIPALHAFSKNLADRKKIRVQMTAYSGVEALTIADRTVLFRVAQEALNNVARHARATEVKIAITPIARGIRMEIIDNGKSFQVGKTLRAKNTNRLGLIGMRERIEMIGGSLAIESSPGTGTRIRAEIPFNPEQIIK